MNIKYLTFECSTNCNMNCKFCFSNWRDKLKELNSNQIKKVLKIMKSKGLETINFTGGEPLLRKDITEILKYSKKIGLKTIITTNGLLLKNKIAEIADYTDYIGLPLDSSNKEIHNKLRISKHKNHYKLILELIELLNQEYPKIGIKINTVVSKKNTDSIIGIGKIIKGKVISWKLSCFVPGAFGKNYQNEFKISDNNYIKIVNKCKNKKLNIISSIAYSRDKACIILSCTGHLLKPCKNSFIDLGKIDKIDDKKLKNNFDFKKSEHFLNKTYPKI